MKGEALGLAFAVFHFFRPGRRCVADPAAYPTRRRRQRPTPGPSSVEPITVSRTPRLPIKREQGAATTKANPRGTSLPGYHAFEDQRINFSAAERRQTSASTQMFPYLTRTALPLKANYSAQSLKPAWFRTARAGITRRRDRFLLPQMKHGMSLVLLSVFDARLSVARAC